MKKAILLIAATVLTAGFSYAQTGHEGHNHDDHAGHNHGSAQFSPAKPVAPNNGSQAGETSSSTLTVENMAFEKEIHDFGTIPEGPAAEVEFKFTNTGAEPINLKQVNASCGCTTPSWSKEPILPGQTGVIKASYATERRPGGFTKSITVVSDAGTKVLTIKGSVEAAPTGSAPTATKSLISK